MYSLVEFHEQLAAFQAKLTEALEHAQYAVELVREAQQTFIQAHNQAESWIPSELMLAEERLSHDIQRLSTVGQIISNYEARL